MKSPSPFKDDWNEAVSGIISAVFDLTAFVSATFTVKNSITTLRVRAVEIKGDTLWQFNEGANSENLPRTEAARRLREFLLGKEINSAHVLMSDCDHHYRVSKKGRVLFSKGAAAKTRDPAAARAHDKEKDHPLGRFDSARLLRVLGFADETGAVKPSMSAKYRQVNEFLKELTPLIVLTADSRINLFDVGCGKSHLSFCAKAFLEATVPGLKIKLTGIDLKENVIASCKRMAEALGWEKETDFVLSDIAEFKPGAGGKPDIVLSLHACDTATDEALAFGVENGAAFILCAPCCQHDLQTRLANNTKHRALLRNAILRERFADILTDTFRAQILRVAGYKTTVVEFTDSDATARNILIKAVRAGRGGNAAALAEYQDLAREWECEPYLAKRLANLF